MSTDDGTMAANIEIAQMWTLNDDRQSVKLRLPPLPLHGLPEPLRVTIDFEADMVDEMIRHLADIRSRMLRRPVN